MSEDNNYFYRVHYESPTVSFWEVFHTRAEVYKFVDGYSDGQLSSVKLTIVQDYGWDEREREELARLKAKYEPEVKS